MHYIRLLKNPVISKNQHSGKKRVKHGNPESTSRKSRSLQGLLTITTDLGDSFYPYDVDLRVEASFHKEVTVKTPCNNFSDDEPTISAKRRKIEPSTDTDEHVRSTASDVLWEAGSRELSFSLLEPHDADLASFHQICLKLTATESKRASIAHGATVTMPSIIGLEATITRKGDREELHEYRPVTMFGPHDTKSGLQANITPWKHTLMVEGGISNQIAELSSHVWDAGVALASFIPHIIKPSIERLENSLISQLPKFTECVESRMENRLQRGRPFNIIELGAGCAPLASSLAYSLQLRHPSSAVDASEEEEEDGANIEHVHIALTDLDEDCYGLRNVGEAISRSSKISKQRDDGDAVLNIGVAFQLLDWEDIDLSKPNCGLPDGIAQRQWDLITASDVTYNAASMPALIRTISTLLKHSSRDASIGDDRLPLEGSILLLALKQRHQDERMLWDQLRLHKLTVAEGTRIWCPHTDDADVGDLSSGEWVDVYVFKQAAEEDEI